MRSARRQVFRTFRRPKFTVFEENVLQWVEVNFYDP